MPDVVTITVNGRPIRVAAGTTVVAAVMVSGAVCTPVCGMGICFQCRVTIDGVAHSRSCQTLCRNGMEICTDG